MEKKNVLLVGGGVAALFLLSKLGGGSDYIQQQIKKEITKLRSFYEYIYDMAIGTGTIQRTTAFEDWPWYVIVLQSNGGVSGKSHYETTVGDIQEIEVNSTTPYSVFPVPTEYKGKPVEKVVFDVNGKSITVFTHAVPTTTLGEMLSGKAKYYRVKV